MDKNNYFNKKNSCYIIAEIGVNHNGDMDLAKQMIDTAYNIGINAVKFQTFTAESLVTKDTPKVKYQKINSLNNESHFEMIKKLELSHKDHIELKEYCDNLNLDFLSTPYDISSAKFLNELDVKLFKIASADLVDIPLHKYIAHTNKPTIISVGMGTLGEIEDVLKIYKKANNPNILLLHCVSNYPCSDKSLNLNVINTLKTTFDIPVGFSDHSEGSEAAILSIALGAKVIEKHFTLNKSLPGPDHKASSTPKEFLSLIKSIRRAEKMLGDSVKECQAEEKEMSRVSRKSIALAKNIKKGELVKSKHLTMMRPGTGLSYSLTNFIIGSKAKKDLTKGSLIKLEDFIF